MDPIMSVLAFLLFGFIGIVLLVIAAKTIRIVPQATVMLVERLGRFDKVASSGLNLLVPFLDRPRAVYWTNTRPGLTSIDTVDSGTSASLPPNQSAKRSASVHSCHTRSRGRRRRRRAAVQVQRVATRWGRS